jgi:hypothetical protein
MESADVQKLAAIGGLTLITLAVAFARSCDFNLVAGGIAAVAALGGVAFGKASQ